MSMHWLLRIGNGNHFMASSIKKIWGIDSTISCGKHFIKNVKEGDIIWFVKTGGVLVGVATFVSVQKRECGPLIAFTQTNEELGWTEYDGNWDTEVHYRDLYNIEALNFTSVIKGSVVIRSYNDNCKVKLPEEYELIVRYSKAIKTT